MLNRLMITLGILFTWQGVLGQNQEDALRYSERDLTGTARMQAMGGAQASLGADMGAFHINPAGLGMYRKSEFSLSPSLRMSSNEVDYFGKPTSDRKDNINVNNIGVVLTTGDDAIQGWKSFSFGFSYSRQRNLHKRFTYKAINPETSMTDFFGNQASGLDLNGTSQDSIFSFAELGYWGYLVFDPDGDGIYDSPVVTNGGVLQQESVVQSGGVNQWDIAAGFNYNDQFYIGGSIGIASLSFKQERAFKEEDINDTIPYFDRMTLEDELKTSGTGINFTIGAIMRPVEWVRLGVSLKTPTYYTMEDEWSARLTDVYLETNPDVPGEDKFIDLLEFNSGGKMFSQYNLTTPMRATIGGAVFFDKKGFITMDIDYMNYSTALLRNKAGVDEINPLDFNDQNALIQELYTSSFNFKLGGEYLYGPFAMRAGFAHIGDPYKKGVVDDVNRARTYVTIGGGYRMDDFFVDFAIINQFWKETYSPYVLPQGNQPVVSIKNRSTSSILTLGWRF